MELPLLGTLRYLGREWTFDDAFESTGISVDVLSNFFENFVICGSEYFCDKHARLPTDEEEFEHDFCEFESAVFPDAVVLKMLQT